MVCIPNIFCNFVHKKVRKAMIEKHIILEDVDPVVFYGVNNVNIQMVKALYPKLRIVARGNVLHVMGDELEMCALEENVEKLRAETRFRCSLRGRWAEVLPVLCAGTVIRRSHYSQYSHYAAEQGQVVVFLQSSHDFRDKVITKWCVFQIYSVTLCTKRSGKR